MGGRGTASGLLPYGSEYKSILQSGNIKFVSVNSGSPTAPLITQTKGRVYVTVNEQTQKLKSISYYDREGKRFKQIDLDHYHKIDGKAVKPHTQYGYYHDGKTYYPDEKESHLIDKVTKVWYNRNGKS